MSDPDSSDELRLDFEGIHVLSTGSVYALAESGGCAYLHFSNIYGTDIPDDSRRGVDLRVLPALVPERFRNESSHAVEVELTTRISKLKEKIDAGLFEQDSAEADDSPKTNCSFQLFAQLEQTNVPKDLMDELESEIDEPTGITTVNAPELVFDGVLLSQNCSIFYEIKHTVGVQYVNSCFIGKK